MPAQSAIESRIKRAAVLLILGLLAESLCLIWSRPLAFIFLLTFGGLFIFLGIVVYLLAIASPVPHHSAEQNEQRP